MEESRKLDEKILFRSHPFKMILQWEGLEQSGGLRCFIQSMTTGLVYDSWTIFENAIPAEEDSFDWQNHSILLNDNHNTREVYPLMARYAHFGGTLSPMHLKHIGADLDVFWLFRLDIS
jgi:hypothetical protein